MRAVLQRVHDAKVTVENEIVGQIGPGLLLLICAMPADTVATADALALKISKLRMFRDDAGKMNRSLTDVKGSALVVSQFTLAADLSRGNRPGFSGAAAPQDARALYAYFCKAIEELGIPTQTGQFGAEMTVQLTNDGPVTFWLDTDVP
ncbi:MAG: D-aminoacyl-tRNA deacylase [Sulfitobacter sp.]